MNPRRSIWDRLIQPVKPRLVTTFAPPPTQIAPGLWSLDRRLRMPGGLLLPSRTTVIRLRAESLLVVSPPPVEAGGLDALDALGAVDEVLVPNSFHYLNAPGFLTRYPRARLRTAPGLHERVPSFPRGEELSAQAPPSWSAVVEHRILGPVRGLSEVALFHRPSATLIVTDLAFHMLHFAHPLERVAWRLSGVPAGFGPSRTARLLLLDDRAAAAAFLERVLAWPFERVLVAHGEPLETNAAEVFRRAFAPHLAPPA
ncbi:MAG TPA: DUF4336 domain-containing protein [Candidatus Dormibacteraeota bacterium]|nr:DUF4336 domain-containing protein [Candidatus Dormibacteraeota bacterium]